MAENKPTDLAKNFKEIISDKVRVMFVDLIPEAEWSAMVEKEIKAFFEEDLTVYVNTNYGNARATLPGKGNTRFRQLVWDEMNELVQKKLKEEANSNELWSYINQFSGYGTGKGKLLIPKVVEEIMNRVGGGQLMMYLLTPLISDIVTGINNR